MKKVLIFFIFTGITGNIPHYFKTGEEFIYSVKTKFLGADLTLGKATLRLKEIKKIGREKCYHLIFEVKSNIRIRIGSTNKKIFVHNRGESYCSVKDFSVLRFERYTNEKFPWRAKKREEKIVEIMDGKAYYSGDPDYSDTLNINPQVKDLISTIYYLRTLKNLEKRPSVTVWILNENTKKYGQLEIKNKGREKIETEVGKFTCIKLEFLMQESGLFSTDNMIIWLDIEERIPVKMTIENLDFRMKSRKK